MRQRMKPLQLAIKLEIPPGKRAFKVLTVADGLDNRRR
jgi:hypothetical protein